MFASDFPHWDFDSSEHAFPRLPEAMRQRILTETARELFRLPSRSDAPSENGHA
jgi:predicted TIM-barrel fold metal-dependent hydrolase